VLASRGSVIPLFLEQIKRGGPVTITSSDMSRFLISLEDAVDIILAAIADGRTGETYVPVCSAATVSDIAAALIGDRSIDTVVTGVRPGEKLHEILISEEEARHVRRRGDYFAISSMLPEIATAQVGTDSVMTGEYSSKDARLDVTETRALLRKYGLLPEQQTDEADGELLR
jgi:FlaA1/EpsC-like NDP-sugar epimerase